MIALRKFIPVIIFLLAFLLRIYQLPSRAIFTADEEYQATYAKTIVDDFHPVWIGVSAADTGFYLGPYFTYLTAGLLKISDLDPLILNYAGCLIGAITSTLLYLLGSSLYGRKVGLIAGLLYAASPLMVYFDQRYWNPNPIPLITVFLLWCLFKLKSNPWWLIGIALALGSIWHIHLSLVPLYALTVYYLYRHKNLLQKRHWFVSLLAFLLMLLPLVIFDYYHAYSNLKTPLRLLQNSSHELNLTKNLELLGTTLARSLYLSPGFSSDAEVKFNCPGEHTAIPLSLAILSLLALGYALLRLPKHRFLLGGPIVLLVVAFVLYPGPVASYYALGLLPLFFFALAVMFRRYWWLVIPVFLILSIRTLLQTDSGYSLAVKRQLISQVMDRVGEQPFVLVEAGTCHAYAGWRYLFVSSGHTPSWSSADASLGWLYSTATNFLAPAYHVTIGVKSEFAPPSSPLFTEESGHYTAYIEKVTP